MNVFACLVHEEPVCVHDLIANLRHLDPESGLVLYNGGRDPTLLCALDQSDHSIAVHPQPRVMAWGDLLDFALDCMRFAAIAFDFATITMVDSDQLLVSQGWSAAIATAVRNRPEAGLFGNLASSASRTSDIEPTRTAHAETHLWRPILTTLPGGPEVYPQWTFWPSTVVTRAASESVVALFERDDVKSARQRTRVLATEEVLVPTFVCATGFEMAPSPDSFAYVRFRQEYSEHDVHTAMAAGESYWMHSVPRRYDHPLRRAIRDAHGGYH